MYKFSKACDSLIVCHIYLGRIHPLVFPYLSFVDIFLCYIYVLNMYVLFLVHVYTLYIVVMSVSNVNRRMVRLYNVQGFVNTEVNMYRGYFGSLSRYNILQKSYTGPDTMVKPRTSPPKVFCQISNKVIMFLAFGITHIKILH